MAGADHDAVLDVDRQSADDHPSSDATERHQRDCQRPETDRPIEFGLGMPGRPGDQDRPGSESDEVDDSERLIRRRVIGAGVISVVEAERSCKHEPQGQREEEQTDLDAEADMVSDRASIREGDRRHDERDGQAGHVRRSDRPAGVPASTMARPSADRRWGAVVRWSRGAAAFSRSRIVISHRSQCPVPVPSRGGCDGARSRRPRLNRFQYIQTLRPQGKIALDQRLGTPNQPFRQGTRRVAHQAEPPGSSGVGFEPAQRQDADRRRFREVGPDKRPLSRGALTRYGRSRSTSPVEAGSCPGV